MGRQAARGELRDRRPGPRLRRQDRRASVLAVGPRVPRGDAAVRRDGQPRRLVLAARRRRDAAAPSSREPEARSRRKTSSGPSAKAQTKDSMKAFAKLTARGRRRAAHHLRPAADRADRGAGRRQGPTRRSTPSVLELFRGYRRSLQPDRRTLLESYRYVDLARKVVGVGSVGTRCWIMLLLGRDDERPALPPGQGGRTVGARAVRSAAASTANHGQRVVEGQRLMQAASDIFLGWIRSKHGLDGVDRATSTSGSSGTGRRRPTSTRSCRGASSSTRRRAAGRSRARTPARATASRSRPISARATSSIARSPTSRSRTPIRTSATTRLSCRPPATAGSRRRRVSSP